MNITINVTILKDLVFISSLCYNVYLNHANAEILNKQNLAVIELCDKLSLKIINLEQKIILKSTEWVSGVTNESLIYYCGIGVSVLVSLIVLYYASAYVQESALYKVTKLVDKSVGIGADKANSWVDWLSTKPLKESNSKSLFSSSTKTEVPFIENDVVSNKIMESLDSNDKMFITYDITDKNNPLSVALLTGGKNFEPTVHESPISELPSVEYSMEAFLSDRDAVFKNLIYD